ncbi:MAG: hypothetical protein RLZZ26_477 [Candidatus Parcubacteria bacterium]|jgi:acid phosphatase (class A)
MTDKNLSLIGIIGLILLVGGYFFIAAPRSEARKDALTFSNTMTWDPQLLAISNQSTIYPEELFSNISLPPPPKNSSPETARELALLHSYRTLRSPQEVENIKNEVDGSVINFGGYTLATYEDPAQFPATAALLSDSYNDIGVIVMREKKLFDRVRASALDTTLDTVIPVPGHPSYPSGHSTQMHFIAYVFSELAPARRDEFIARADQIAKNREVAGLHYPSDTAAGILLAQQFFSDIMKSPKFETLLAAAKREWATRGLTASTSSQVLAK